MAAATTSKAPHWRSPGFAEMAGYSAGRGRGRRAGRGLCHKPLALALPPRGDPVRCRRVPARQSLHGVTQSLQAEGAEIRELLGRLANRLREADSNAR